MQLHVDLRENQFTEGRNYVHRIKEEVLNLPEKYRYVVMMYLIEGYDHSEIAQVLGITETTCRTRLLRGKGHLKNMLKEKNYATGY